MGDAVVLTGTARIKVASKGTSNAFGVRFMDVMLGAMGAGRW